MIMQNDSACAELATVLASDCFGAQEHFTLRSNEIICYLKFILDLKVGLLAYSRTLTTSIGETVK